MVPQSLKSKTEWSEGCTCCQHAAAPPGIVTVSRTPIVAAAVEHACSPSSMLRTRGFGSVLAASSLVSVVFAPAATLPLPGESQTQALSNSHRAAAARSTVAKGIQPIALRA